MYFFRGCVILCDSVGKSVLVSTNNHNLEQKITKNSTKILHFFNVIFLYCFVTRIILRAFLDLLANISAIKSEGNNVNPNWATGLWRIFEKANIAEICAGLGDSVQLTTSLNDPESI